MPWWYPLGPVGFAAKVKAGEAQWWMPLVKGVLAVVAAALVFMVYAPLYSVVETSTLVDGINFSLGYHNRQRSQISQALYHDWFLSVDLVEIIEVIACDDTRLLGHTIFCTDDQRPIFLVVW